MHLVFGGLVQLADDRRVWLHRLCCGQVRERGHRIDFDYMHWVCGGLARESSNSLLFKQFNDFKFK